jgi:membrane-bound lytic murein transglycosylase B
VSLLAPLRRARVTALAVAGAAALAVAPAVVPLGQLSAAHATPGSPATSVQQMLAKVKRLQAQAKAAEHRYGAAFNGVANSVTDSISADQASGEAQILAADAQTELLDRVRGLYESGGSLATYAAVLDSGSFNSLSDRTEMATRVVSAQIADVRDVLRQAASARLAASKAETRERSKIHTERGIADAADRVEALLSEQKTLLDQANQKLAAVAQAQAALNAENSSFGSITDAAIANLRILPPSTQYLDLYKAAATTCPGLPWTVLAAIGQVETGHGRNTNVSSAGAMGPMQFEPATFERYAVDGDGDGIANIVDPADAIYSAAHYLCANGAGAGPAALSRAIFHYNHAGWYVEMVLKLSGMYSTQYS